MTSSGCYLRDLVFSSSARHSLSSSHAGLLAVPSICRAHTNPRAFAVLSAWNSPVPDIHMIHSLPSFIDVQKIPPYLLDHHAYPHVPHHAYSALFFPIALIFLWHITCLFPYCLYHLPLIPKLQEAKSLCFSPHCLLRTIYFLLNKYLLKEYESALKL